MQLPIEVICSWMYKCKNYGVKCKWCKWNAALYRDIKDYLDLGEGTLKLLEK